MDISEIHVGLEYEVEATGTKSTEIWTVVSKKQNPKEVWEIECKGSKTAYNRVFTPEQFRKVHTHMAKDIVSETVEQVGTIAGKAMNIEDIKYMPFHERRGRKKAS